MASQLVVMLAGWSCSPRLVTRRDKSARIGFKSDFCTVPTEQFP